MKVILDEAEIGLAVKEYLERRGFTVLGDTDLQGQTRGDIGSVERIISVTPIQTPEVTEQADVVS